MLFVVDPVALILSAVCMCILTKPMSLIILPVAIVNVTIRVDKTAAAVCFVIFPVSFIYAAVGPDLITPSVSLFCLRIPLALVLCAIWQSYHVFLLTKDPRIVILIRIQAVDEFWESFTDCLNALPLLLQLYGIHFDMNSATIK